MPFILYNPTVPNTPYLVVYEFSEQTVTFWTDKKSTDKIFTSLTPK